MGLLGTGELGHDVFARRLQGASVSLSIGLVAVAIPLAAGVAVGAAAGCSGQRRIGFVTLDTLLMRFTGVMLCFPTFFLMRRRTVAEPVRGNPAAAPRAIVEATARRYNPAPILSRGGDRRCPFSKASVR